MAKKKEMEEEKTFMRVVGLIQSGVLSWGDAEEYASDRRITSQKSHEVGHERPETSMHCTRRLYSTSQSSVIVHHRVTKIRLGKA